VACGDLDVEWVVLTTGGRPEALRMAIESLHGADSTSPVLVVSNGGGVVEVPADTRLLVSDTNLGIPGGRDLGARSTQRQIVGFLDDDAEFLGDMDALRGEFDRRPGLGAVALKLVDERGCTARRHLPRAGAKRLVGDTDVAYFLGGACALRREAYEEVGGYFTDLFYGHEEIELSWRLIDAGWKIRYLADVEVFHPRTEISRHADGWFLTGRNRVWIARRTLPWPVAVVHVVTWLALGMVRAPRGSCRDAYRRGWVSGWRSPIAHRPISWRTVWRLTRLGRPPII
jgi:GT2 family glycosyltransferase